ncbi:MAG TPA: glycoside hydrolase family 15 protein [Alphaproteobacteria bacterium]|jgi:GH15 family glucan-1,4-alpha-glucosidase
MSLPIEGYGFIGNMVTSALVGADGSIDWLCLPHFDSGACFASLLGTPANGRWLVTPQGEVTATSRRYRGETMVLETRFETAEGAVTLIDFMPLDISTARSQVVRLVRGERGRVAMRTELSLRFDYGNIVPWVRRQAYGIRAVAGPDSVQLRTPVKLVGRDFVTHGEFTVAAGETVPFLLSYAPSNLGPPKDEDCQGLLEQTEGWWRKWAARCTYKGEWRDGVLRSLMVLKALSFRPTGGIVAAPTTSLPEQIGGVRNWDYRFCWIRDATFTLYALLTAGYRREARAWREWLLRAVAGNPEGLQIMYSLGGARRLSEVELDWLEGYEGSKPVRVGNAAYRQFQLDIFGELMDALHVSRKYDLKAYDEAWTLQKALIGYLEKTWRQPDEGIWEVRGPRQHFTHSKMMAWVAVDRAIKAVEQFGQSGPVEDWKRLRDEIHADVCQHGFDAKRNSFVQYYGGQTLDAALLLMPQVGFLPPEDPRVQGTIAAIEKTLVVDGLVMRYDTAETPDGLPAGEGSFLACSFWLVDALALSGRYDDAVALFERLLALRNDLGLLAEEYHPKLKRQLGNFPQAFSHVALINTANNLTSLHKGPAKQRADR